MCAIDLAGVMHSLAADLLDDRTIALAQLQLRLAHENISEYRVQVSEVYACSVIYVSAY
jgi:hypothetical protein